MSDTPTEAKNTQTEYVILGEYHQPDDDEALWDLCGRKTASSAHAAIRKHAEGAGAGTYIAIPSRSWKPVTVAAETRTILKLS